MALRETYLQLVITCVVFTLISCCLLPVTKETSGTFCFVFIFFVLLFCCFATMMRRLLDCLRWMWFHRNYIIIVLTPLAVIALPLACPSSVSVCYFACVCGSGGNRLFHHVCLGSNFTSLSFQILVCMFVFALSLSICHRDMSGKRFLLSINVHCSLYQHLVSTSTLTLSVLLLTVHDTHLFLNAPGNQPALIS